MRTQDMRLPRFRLHDRAGLADADDLDLGLTLSVRAVM